MPNPLIVAHRGASQLAPENSLAAFDFAIQEGADVIEFDIHLSRDGEIVVHHDYYLGRVEMGSGFIGDYSFAELQTLDIGKSFGEKFSGTTMPSLRDVLHLAKGKARFEIELRCPTLSFLKLVLDEVTRVGVDNEIEITSPHIPLLAHVKTISPNIRTGVFFPSFPLWMKETLGQQHIIDWLTLVGAQVAHLPFKLLNENFVNMLHSKNLVVHGADLNDEYEIRSAIGFGIDQFSTDVLEKAIKVRNTIIAG